MYSQISLSTPTDYNIYISCSYVFIAAHRMAWLNVWLQLWL